jgi:hypothetical protein
MMPDRSTPFELRITSLLNGVPVSCLNIYFNVKNIGKRVFHLINRVRTQDINGYISRFGIQYDLLAIPIIRFQGHKNISFFNTITMRIALEFVQQLPSADFEPLHGGNFYSSETMPPGL